MSREARVKLPVLARDSAQRKADELTVRLRNTGCEGIATGSGFAISPTVLLTNRHVLAGADTLQVSTWDGHSYDVSSAEVGVLGDLGVVTIGDGRLPLVGDFGRDARPGDVVTVVGYPLGGPLTITRGIIVDRVDGTKFGIQGAVLRMTATVKPGNSGGPVLDQRGRIIAVVFAIELKTNYALAIPIDTVRDLIRIGGFAAVPACGSP